MERNQVRIGAVLSYISLAMSTVISLVYTPVMIERLGHSEYGVYQMVLPIISYLQMLSFGLTSAYVRFYSRFKVAGDKKNMARLNGMFVTIYLILGALVMTIGFSLSFHGDVIFGTKFTPDEVALGEKLLRIMTVNAAIAFPISVFESHVTINERYLFLRIVGIGKQVLNPLLMIPLLILGYRSITLTVVSLCFTVLSGIMHITYCLVKLKMPFSFRGFNFGLLREMFGFTVYVFIGIVVDNFNWSIDRLLLGWLHGSNAVTIYVVAAQLNIFYLTFASALSDVMTPRVHRLVAEGRPMRELDALFTKVGRLQFLLLGCIFLGFVAVGRPFVMLWGGGEEFGVDYYTTLLLFFATIWPNVQTVGLEIQRAKNMHKFRSLVYGGVAIANALISIPLCMRWEGLGAAIGTMLATFVGNVLLMNWYYDKRIGLNIRRFWRHILHLVPAMLPPAVVAVLLARSVHATSYFGLILPGLLLVAVYGGSMWLFGMNRYERELVMNPVRKVLGRLMRRGGRR
ncbi:MAG: lipopolysaccharide biosynthesis protein [Clostridiales bacterium]|nr:lipopolysaccharide biosynthesis protein [Candidatus Cacconaster stercorequi]